MHLDDLADLEKQMMKEVVKRRSLGGFDANAETILLLCEWIFKLTGHIIDQEKHAKKVAKK